MSKTMNPMLSGIGIRMSESGHAFGPAARMATPAAGAFVGATCVATTAVKPQGYVSLVSDGDVRVQVRTTGEATGRRAWSPPTT